MGVRGIRRVFSNRNVLVVSLTDSLSMFFQMLYWSSWSKYLEEAPPEGLGLSIPIIGLLSMLQQSQMLIFQLPGGILADRIGRKKVTLIAAATRMIMPLIYLWARKWEFLAIGSIFGALSSLGMPAFTALIAESLPRDQMGTGYAIYGMVRRVPMLFTGIIGGILMDTLGVGKGTRICLIGSFIGAVISFVARYLFLTETLVRRPGRRSSLTEDFREVLPLFKGSLRGMQITSAVSQFAGRMVMSLTILYVINVIGLSYTQWGFISTTMSIVSLITAMPGGILVDKFNRAKLIIFARAISPITTLGYIFLRDFWSILGVRMVAG
ncbi:MAG: MFS transporter, partial [Candidatus Bathyarchaeia archaeon]